MVDLLTLHGSPPSGEQPKGGGGLAVAEAAPKVRRKLTAATADRTRRRTVAVRHVTGHRLVAVVEIVSPANKDRAAHVEELAGKIEEMLRRGVHVLLVDLFAPGAHDLRGIHGAVWEHFDDECAEMPTNEPFTLASYVGDRRPDAYLEHLAVGAALPDMPLFLHPERYVNVPLEATYQAAFRGTPSIWRNALEDPNGSQ